MVTVDLYQIVKDFVSGHRERKEIETMTGRYFTVKTANGEVTGRTERFSKVGKSTLMTMETDHGKTSIPLENVQGMTEISSSLKLQQLIKISESRDNPRSTYLSWVLGAAKPVEKSSQKWFEEEVSILGHQIHILTNLFPHRNYEELGDELVEIVEDFKESEQNLDKIIESIEKKKVTQVKQIYHKGVSKLPGTESEPDVISAISGMFFAASSLESLMKKVDDIVANINDAMTVANIIRESS
ncbi:MAG: hypothetical protein M0Z77_08430 [Thermoplasmatales archaeon]|jgi:hypothetical protein|nr:hypothetical protein [Candidatus Thermoplasmatota archaeon]MCL6002565.1 hypothetical protein [Candidatus Thermoplasmatota archaeon]MDA8055653.1 hypothetical protein [Thermoplasmatales archaeon]